MKTLLPFLFLCIFPCAFSQITENPYAGFFEEAYQENPSIPRGFLEAVAWHNTRVTHLDGTEQESCIGLPRNHSVMGLVEDGKGYFQNNLLLIAAMASYTPAEMKLYPRTAILAYAKALQIRMEDPTLKNYFQVPKFAVPEALQQAIRAAISLAEFPAPDNINGSVVNVLAIRQFEYGLLYFLKDQDQQVSFDFPGYQIDLSLYFKGEWEILLEKKIYVDPLNQKIFHENFEEFQLPGDIGKQFKSQDYPPALWNPAASCNYGSRNGTAVSAITIHTVQGSYAGCIAWFQNCQSSVSAHYVLRSSDGQVTQMVLESQRAFHVGSENPYTIGFEHEGYVNNPAWYTTAMYNSSALLSVDIVNSGYGINPIRTAWWLWTATTYYNQSGIPGACSRIKGHQHYPNQTHTDPGPNWDWNRYYQLINPAPAPIIFNGNTGTLQDPGGNGNYGNDQRVIWLISPPNAASVSLHFSSFHLENQWDYLYIYDGADIQAPLIGYYTGTNIPGTLSSSQGTITLEFRSDCATTAPGFELVWNSTVVIPQNPDQTPPVTNVTVNGTWQTQDFLASFTESDDSSGLEQGYFQVADYDGFEWRANPVRGFFNDHFDLGLIHPQWTQASGTWSSIGGFLTQADEADANSNIYAALQQDLSDRYLYQFAMHIGGSGTNRRAGFHYMADSASLPNRGNGYFVWFRVDQNRLQFYKVTNDVFSLESELPVTVNPGQWYDYKIIYDRITGKTTVYQDNVFMGSWTDPQPYQTGKYISFRSGNAHIDVNDLKVYRSRLMNTTTLVEVGNCATCVLRYQSPDPSTPAGRIRSVVADSAGNLSSIAYYDVFVDWTPPSSPATVGDGITGDADTSVHLSVVSGNWSVSADTHSGITRYFYALGTTPGDSNIMNWTDNWFMTSFTDSFPVLPGTYYLSVKAENGAGLLSSLASSDGILYIVEMSLEEHNEIPVRIFPNPSAGNIYIQWEQKDVNGYAMALYNMLGQVIWENAGEGNAGINLFVLQPQALHMTPGMYILRLNAGKKSTTVSLFVTE